MREEDKFIDQLASELAALLGCGTGEAAGKQRKSILFGVLPSRRLDKIAASLAVPCVLCVCACMCVLYVDVRMWMLCHTHTLAC